jgi:hypothetical protein
MSMRINFSKPSRELLIDLLNYAHGYDLPYAMFTFGVPRTLSAPEQAEYGRNTELRLEAAPNSGYDNHVDVRYNRIDLNRLFKNAVLVGVDENFNNSMEALALVNAKYGLSIAPSEIVSINAVDFQVAIEISQSEVYLPGTRIVVAINIDEQIILDFEDATDRLWHFTNFQFPPVANIPLDIG